MKHLNKLLIALIIQGCFFSASAFSATAIRGCGYGYCGPWSNTKFDAFESWCRNPTETYLIFVDFNVDGNPPLCYLNNTTLTFSDVSPGYYEYDYSCDYPRDETGACLAPVSSFYLAQQDLTNLIANAQQCDNETGDSSPSVHTPKPINTTNGNKYRSENDYTQSGLSPLNVTRFYSSNKNQSTDVGVNWRHSYTSSLTANIHSQTVPYVANDAEFSQQYGTAKEACESGWNDIKGQYTPPAVANSTALYDGTTCTISDGASALGIIAVRNSTSGVSPFPPQDNIVIERANGNTIVFTSVNSNWIAPSDKDVSLVQATSGYILTTAQDTVEEYNLSGQLISITDRKGIQQTLTYNATSGLLESVIDSFGQSLGFAYVGSKLTTVTLPDTTQLVYGYDTNNNFSTVKREDTTVKTYVYEDARFPNALTGIVDEKSQRYMTFSYDTQGRATTSELAGGVEKVTVNFVDDLTSTVTDALGQLRTYRFTTINGEKKLADIEGAPCGSCGGKATRTTYDASGYVDSSTDFNGNVTTYVNNARGLALSRTEAVGTKDERTTSYEWHSSYALPTCIIENVKTTRLSYTANGSLETRTSIDTSDTALFATPATKVCSAVEARGDYATLNKRSIGYTYYPNYGLVKTIDGARTDVNDITSFSYDATGNLTLITNALGQETQLNNYTARGKPQEIIDANGLVTTLTYDVRGRVDVVKVGGLVTDYDFDAVGNLDLVTRADGSFIDYDYDAAHRLTDVRDQTGSNIHYILDALGNRKGTDIKDASGTLKRTSTAIYNQLGQFEKTIGAALQTTDYLLYDNNGNLKHLKDADGKNTWLGYDALNRLETTTNELNDVSTTVYDAQGNVTRVTDFKGLVTTYNFDGLGNRLELNSPDTGITQYTSHDGNGNVLSMIDAQSQITTYTYDALNRIDFITYHDGSTADYLYDTGVNAKGRLSSVNYTDSTGTKTGITNWNYDSYGRVGSKTETVNSIALTTTYNFNPTTGQLDNVITSGGHTLSYAYLNAQVRGISVDGKSVMSAISYEPFAAANGWTWGNGATQNRTYDLDGQLDTYVLGNTTYDINYTPSGNVQSITDLVNAANNQTFNYDGLHRLKDYNGSTGNEAYDYDAGSNRIGLTDVTTTLADTYIIDPVSNKLTSITGMTNKTYTYNAVGSVTSDGLHTYDYDARNRLISVDNNLAVYQLNALGQRVQKDASGAITLFHYDEQGQLVAEADSTGFVNKEYIYFGTMPVAILNMETINQSVDKIIDSIDTGVLLLGNWKVSTSVAGFEGLNYLYHAANSMPASSVVTDNGSAGFSATGTWKLSTSVKGYEGSSYQFHAANGASPDSIVIDNVAGSAVGTWPKSTSVKGYEATNYQYHAAGTGLNSFSWLTGVTTPNTYNVYAKWTSYSNRASNAKYTVSHSLGDTTVIVNQQQGGSSWVLLGEFSLDSNSKVSLSDDANGYVIADGISVTSLDAQPNTARWSIAPATTGNYTVYAKWTAHANRASNATYTVHHVGGTTSITQNQRTNGSKWAALGEFNLDANSTVTLNDQADGYVIADAVAIAPVDAAPNQAIWQLDTQAGNYDLYAKWTSHANRASDAPFNVSHTTGETPLVVNQQTNGAQWNLLGNFVFDMTSTVSLSDQANGYVIADALRVVGNITNTQSTLSYIHTDHLGTPRVIVDENNTTLWSWHSDPFGKTLPNEDVDGDGVNFEFNLRFAGQYYDVETALHYNYFRDYDPSTGRYVQSDPIGLAGGLNTYGYVGGNPLSYSDPYGLLWYNNPPPQTVPTTGDTAKKAQCVESCLKAGNDWDGKGLLCTGGQESEPDDKGNLPHSKNSHHYKNEAIDIAGPKFNKYSTGDVLKCAAQCGFGAGHFEDFKGERRDHWHLQVKPGNGVPSISK